MIKIKFYVVLKCLTRENTFREKKKKQKYETQDEIEKRKKEIKMKKENILKSVKYTSEKPIKSYTAIKWQR